jgi:molybdopterin-guanine dinucleotide biosynthesis protein A
MIMNLSARYVPVDEIKKFDPDLLTFTNINKVEDLERMNAQGMKEQVFSQKNEKNYK